MTTLTAIFSLFIALYIVGLMATAGNNTHKLLHYLRSKYKIEVFFKQGVSNEEAVGMIHSIKQIDGVRNATIIEKKMPYGFLKINSERILLISWAIILYLLVLWSIWIETVATDSGLNLSSNKYRQLDKSKKLDIKEILSAR